MRLRAAIAASGVIAGLALVLSSAAQSPAPARAEADSWTEIDAPFSGDRDALLRAFVAPLVHERLAGRLKSWHFFFEPQLRLRLLWKSEADRAAARPDLRAAYTDALVRGLIDGWRYGAHGERGQVYEGEAAEYGAAIWPVVLRDWEAGSEYALALAQHDGALPHPRSYYFDRRVHLFANEAFGSWEAEVDLTICHALGYARLVEQYATGRERRAAARAVHRLEQAAAAWRGCEEAA